MDSGGAAAPGATTFFKGITLGNVITWAVLLATAAMIYGSTTEQIKQNAAANERQDRVLGSLQETFSDIKVALANGNGDIRVLREVIERMESDQRRLRRSQ